MLIAMQRPDATRVAGFHKWQDLGRQVRKGEHGIRILAPHTYKGTDDNGDEETRVYFRAVSVFDLSQTDGEPLPEIPCEPLTGDSHAGMLPRLEQFATSIGWTIETGETGNADGWAMPKEQRIRISDRLDEPNRRVRTLVHELVHALGIGYAEYGREVAEVLTETAAFVACRSLGLDTPAWLFHTWPVGVSPMTWTQSRPTRTWSTRWRGRLRRLAMSEVVEGRWRHLRSGEWGCEVRHPHGNLVGQVVEIKRRDGSRAARMRLSKLVAPRSGKLSPLYAIEKLEEVSSP